ncbi:hypothetical protein D8L93_02515 [Sodalis-like symbiont of Bactericera trigonica]|nr:hypothetical protein D8L93_02515 [Sodalis-like symbiont of Bactericera trigonica]
MMQRPPPPLCTSQVKAAKSDAAETLWVIIFLGRGAVWSERASMFKACHDAYATTPLLRANTGLNADPMLKANAGLNAAQG